VGAFDAFMATWSQARATFGEGEPADGSQFDHSARLRELGSQVESASPGTAWAGTASDSYAELNHKHARKLDDIGDLDRQLSREVQRSADVVRTGRQDMDTVRQWVSSVASTLPNNAVGQSMLWPVVSKGSAEVQQILTRSSGELSLIARRIAKIGGQYDALREPRREAPATEASSSEPDPAKLAEFWLDWNDLQARIAEHNAVVPPPPANTPAGARFEAEREELEIEQTRLLLDAAELGLEVLAPTNGTAGG
jgi:uncharacterized protein YukE